jgi:hypothetical protein
MNKETTMITTTDTNLVGEWLEECRNVNGSWASMIATNIVLTRLELDSIFEVGCEWYEEWYEEFNNDNNTDYTVDEFEELVREYIMPEVADWTTEKLADLDVYDWQQAMDETGTEWEYIREALSNEGVTDERLDELEEELAN